MCGLPFKHELICFKKDVRRDEHILTSIHIITFMKAYHPTWLEDYKAAKKDAYKSLLKLCQDFAKRHNFSQRVPCRTKLPTGEVIALQHQFAAKFWDKYHAYEPCDILNIKDTAVHYEMPLAEFGLRKDSRRV
ncbi:hypothetical protein H310_01318 [Aphanomyces invadans]|uniref:Uncharacterized protein n=1 Tax=Aphanomyces invadans TaxID=157072 RepID=A0A024USB9_9STRA|nr:hypothetical protein H310_01318 [Aphanomyces invadans]ETW08807.1 hypothetical protein H310_01318 [Aphanomyces invadans]|eukprot:XP_008862612.1 hypothetical protein H310_01318 [Aphanomyces invadans]